MPRSRHSQPVYEPPLSLGAWEPKARRRLLPAKAGCVAPRLRQPAKRGFTIVEVMMAAIILVVGFVGMIDAITVGSQMLDTARKQQIAVRIIDAEIAKLRMGVVTDISGLANNFTYTLSVNAAGTAVSGDTAQFDLTNNPTLMARAGGFTCTLVKTNVRTNYRKLVYTVTWKSNTGKTFTRTTEMFFGKTGLQLSYQKS